MSTTARPDTSTHDHHAAHGNDHAHLRSQPATERESDAESLMDPVCGMTVSAQSAHRAEYPDRPYFSRAPLRQVRTCGIPERPI